AVGKEQNIVEKEVENEPNVEAEKTDEIIKEKEVASVSGSIAGVGRQRNLIRSHIKNKFITQEFFVEKIQEVLNHCDMIVPELTVTKTNEMLKKEMPLLLTYLNTTLNLYPKTSSSTATTSSADLQQQLYLTIKAKPQDQEADSEIWEILKAKFEKP
ncbi:hypothetical protein Tco_0141658, partial [Tanacetum coccineum]